ncbi:cell wall hydrolase [Ectobacillus sp. JY-23]|uniref:cell wall hydrolase n=1 Tax=Ectobacillus sp. JY-23 TaxID=2933872 RepID=UPI001FF457D9|nr:cell wall hydrolase [Ectobacillus sp. JY-23]UOY91845.1 cell wall hydrolase [Ectobacillus sp. JY-23]
MPRIKYTQSDIELLGRLMRAEAEGEGQQGMLLVGNVGVNRVFGNCLDFKGITNIQQMVYQQQGGSYSFEAVSKGYFYQRARQVDKDLAKKCLDYWLGHPARNSLWFFNPTGSCPAVWWNQRKAGQYKEHCFYQPSQQECPRVF